MDEVMPFLDFSMDMDMDMDIMEVDWTRMMDMRQRDRHYGWVVDPEGDGHQHGRRRGLDQYHHGRGQPED